MYCWLGWFFSRVQPHDNPFTQDGELSHKADYIIRHSKISRTEIHIVDPDSPTPVVEEEIVVQNSAPEQQSAPPPAPSPDEKKENGQMEAKASPKDVKVEVNGDKTNEKPAKPAKGEKKTCKCCVVM